MQVLVLSHHAQRAMALRLAGLPVVEDEGVLEESSVPVVGLLEGRTLDDVSTTLARWRRRRPEMPVVVLADGDWTGAGAIEATVMTPPVTAGEILRTIAELFHADDDLLPQPPPAAEAWPVLLTSTEPVSLPALAAASTLTAGATVEGDRLPGSGSVLVKPLEPPVEAAEPQADQVPTPRQGPSVRRRAGKPIIDVVREAIGSHLPLPAVAEGICARLAVEPGGDVAVMEDRETGLHVLAGIGLRPLEWRDLDQPPDAVARLTGRHRAMVVSDTDALRSQVSMLPLGRHRSLLMARSPEPGHLLVVLGRERSYSKADVRHVLEELDDRSDHVTASLRLRDAAALLTPFAID